MRRDEDVTRWTSLPRGHGEICAPPQVRLKRPAAVDCDPRAFSLHFIRARIAHAGLSLGVIHSLDRLRKWP